MEKDKGQFIIEQLTMWLKKYEIPYVTITEGYVETGPIAEQNVMYDEQVFFLTPSKKLGHASALVCTYQKKLVAVWLENVSDKFLNITQGVGLLYGVPYKEIRKIDNNNYLYLF